MIHIDGSKGEGGGQVFRSSLTLSLLTQQPFTITNIRAGRRKPGILRQHLTCVKAATEISGAKVEGAEMGSQKLVFYPKPVKHGTYSFSVGTAGSTGLVFQTILLPLLRADGISEVTLRGGTHNPLAPPYHFLEESFLPLLHKMGAEVETKLNRYGFYPAGGGEFVAQITPSAKIDPLFIVEEEKTEKITVTAIVANLPQTIAKQEKDALCSYLDISPEAGIEKRVESNGPGNIVYTTVHKKDTTELFTHFGERGVSSKRVAQKCADETKSFEKSGAPVGEHLADQIMLPLYLAGSGAFLTTEPSLHSTTNSEIIKIFTGREILFEERGENLWLCFLKEGN